MSRRSFPQMARCLLAALVALLALAQPAAADTARLLVSPQAIQVGGAETLVEVTLDGVSGLYGLDIRLEFDPTLLEVIDADGGKDGVQVSPGQIPSPDFTVRNEVDNAAGGVWYAATPPTMPIAVFTTTYTRVNDTPRPVTQPHAALPALACLAAFLCGQAHLARHWALVS